MATLKRRKQEIDKKQKINETATQSKTKDRQ